MSELFIRIHDIDVENDFKVYYTTGSTPGNHITGYTQYNGVYPSSTTEITITGLTYETQYWFKIVDIVNNSYIIENIRTHSIDYLLSNCEVTGVTPTPTVTDFTPTPTPTITGATPTITPTYTLTPTITPTIPVTPTPTLTPTYTVTPTPTITLTPTYTPTPLVLTKYCYTGFYPCGDTLHEISGHEPYTGSITYWDAYGVSHTEYYCLDDGLIEIWSSQVPITVAMHSEDCDTYVPDGCAAPTLVSVSRVSYRRIKITKTTTNTDCTNFVVEYANNNSFTGSSFTVVNIPTTCDNETVIYFEQAEYSTWYFRIKEYCGGVEASDYSNVYFFTFA